MADDEPVDDAVAVEPAPEPPEAEKTFTAVMGGEVLTWEALMSALPEGRDSGGWPFQFGTAAGMPASMALELVQWAESRGLDVRVIEEIEFAVIADGQL